MVNASAIQQTLSYGKTITGSVSVTNAAYATDGNTSPGNYASIGSNLQYAKLDLGQSQTIDKVMLWRYYLDGRQYKDVIVQFSNDANFASGVTTVYNNDTDNSAGQGAGTDSQYVEKSEGKTITFKPLNARYMRVFSNGNTVNANNHIVEVQVFKSGIEGTYYYDAFGNITEQTGNVDNNIAYAGYQYDQESGLYYCNARMYDPKVARFLQEDTYTGQQDDPLSLNLYTYCHNEPLMYDDPSGHSRDSLFGLGMDFAKIVINAAPIDETSKGIITYAITSAENTVTSIVQEDFSSGSSSTGSTSTAIGIASIFARPFQNIIGKSSNDISDRFMLLASGSGKQRTALDILKEIRILKKRCELEVTLDKKGAKARESELIKEFTKTPEYKNPAFKDEIDLYLSSKTYKNLCNLITAINDANDKKKPKVVAPAPTSTPKVTGNVEDSFKWEWTGKHVTPEFKAKVVEICNKLGIEPDDLMAVMAFESWLDPTTTNSIGATGLIQFMPSTAKELGTTTDALRKMSAVEQLDYVYAYLKPVSGKIKTVGDIYASILFGKYSGVIGKPDSHAVWKKGSGEYKDNAPLDINKDGVITKGEATKKVTDRRDTYKKK